MKVLIMTDLEGVAGVVSKDLDVTGKYYEKSKDLLTHEVNAAVEGFIKAGAEDILVIDGHGAGAINFELIHPEAKLLHGRPPAPKEVKDEIYRQYDAAAMVGQHAMAGIQKGNLNHTQNSLEIIHYKLNGELIGEIAQCAYYYGLMDIPLIFLSGDDAACEEAGKLIPEIVTAEVKKGLSRNSAISLSSQKACEIIEKRAGEALEKHKKKPLKPLKKEGPYVLEKRYFHTDAADMASGHPLTERIDEQTVVIKSDSLADIIYS